MTNTQANYDAAYSLVLTAHTNGQPVNIRTSTSGVCTVETVVSNR